MSRGSAPRATVKKFPENAWGTVWEVRRAERAAQAVKHCWVREDIGAWLMGGPEIGIRGNL